MAVRRIDPNAKFKVISQFDDAIIGETKEEIEALKFYDEQGVERMKPTRYQIYIEDLDESKLLFDPTKVPTRFVFKGISNSELTEITQKYSVVDVLQKKTDIANVNAMFIEYFNRGVMGIEENGKVEKVTAESVGFGVAVGIGSIVSLYTSVGKNLKKS